MAEVFDFTMFDPKNAKSLADGIMNLSYIYDSNQHIKERKFEIIRDRNWSSTCDKLVLEMKSACLD